MFPSLMASPMALSAMTNPEASILNSGFALSLRNDGQEPHVDRDGAISSILAAAPSTNSKFKKVRKHHGYRIEAYGPFRSCHDRSGLSCRLARAESCKPGGRLGYLVRWQALMDGTRSANPTGVPRTAPLSSTRWRARSPAIW